MSEQFVVFATPAFDHNVTLGYLGSMLQSERQLMDRGISSGHIYIGGDPYLAKVRNLLVARALETYPQMTDFFFLDADLEWDPSAILKLLDHPAAVVAGIYPKKNDTVEFPCELELTDDKRLISKDGWYKARSVPTGFLRIRRHIIDQMIQGCGKYIDGTGGGTLCYNVFEMGYCADDEATLGRGAWWGEDFAWCKKLHNMGGEIWIYPDIDFGHRGGKGWRNNYSGSINAYEAGTAIVKDMTVQQMDSAA